MSDFSNSDFSFSAPAPPPAAQLFTEYQGEHFTPPVVLGDGQYRRVDMPDGSIFQKEGGFGRVYCYQHKKRNTLYALKTPKKTAAIYSIEWELEILNDLNDCEFIVTVHYVEKWKDQMYLMMIPFASKGSLTACLDRYLPRDQYFLYKAVHVIWYDRETTLYVTLSSPFLPRFVFCFIGKLQKVLSMRTKRDMYMQT